MRPPQARWLPRPCQSEREIVTSDRAGPQFKGDLRHLAELTSVPWVYGRRSAPA